MKKFTSLFCIAILICSAMLSYAGVGTVQVIIPGDHTPKSFKMAANVKEGDYLSKTIRFKVKPQYRQNCKVNSVDNLLPLQDFLQNVGAQNVAKTYPHHESPVTERNMIGQKLVDLSLIYSFKYTGDVNIEKVINEMLSLGYFEYVEPWYLPKIHLNPNDPQWASQYHLQGAVAGSIDAVDAWNIETGNSNIVIGLTDTGTELNHPDLAANAYKNLADPINGIDDDGDGYIDDYQGWDVGMNDNDVTWQGNPHGCYTSGDADAVTNNSTYVASPGYNCKFIECKIADASGALVAAYEGIQWLADFSASHGNIIKVISNSWGGSGGGSYGQDIINYAAINCNILICASAGNDGIEEQLFPGSYNNVYRVAASDQNDLMASFSSYGTDVAWAAPGNNILSTGPVANGYTATVSGTSMSSPVSAGSAAIVQSYYNYTNAFQIGERLRQTCDPMSSDAQYNAGKLGKGRLNLYKALTQAAKSIIANPITITDGNDNVFMPGDTLTITGVFTNYLDPCSSAATATLSIVSGGTNATVTQGVFNIGALATLAKDSNTSVPFTVNILNTAAVNGTVQFKLHITDGTFTGDQYFSITVNEDYVDITINDVYTTITSKGRIGYNNDGQAQGLGFIYQLPSPNPLLYEASLMIGVSSTKVSDMFRGASVGNTDFSSTLRAYEVIPAVVSDFDVNGNFNDAPSTTTGPLPVGVHHNAYAWATAPYRKFVILKYIIKNTGASTLSNLHAGIIADWDVPNANSGQDKAAYDATYKMGYVWYVNGPLYAAIKVLNDTAHVNNYIIDNVAGGGGGIDVTTTNGFTTAQKYTVLSTNRNNDAFTATGGDVMDCVSSGPYTIAAGDSIEVAFALIGGDNLVDIQATACAAQSKYDNGCLNVGVKDLETDNFWIYSYPNPAANSVNINYNIIGSNSASLRIMNSLGEVVKMLDNVPVGKNNLTIDVSKFSAGNYFYQMKAGEAVLTKKLTITK